MIARTVRNVVVPRSGAHANFPLPVKRNFAKSARCATFLKFAANRTITCIARDQGRWYKVCAAIRVTKQVWAIAG